MNYVTTTAGWNVLAFKTGSKVLFDMYNVWRVERHVGRATRR